MDSIFTNFHIIFISCFTLRYIITIPLLLKSFFLPFFNDYLEIIIIFQIIRIEKFFFSSILNANDGYLYTVATIVAVACYNYICRNRELYTFHRILSNPRIFMLYFCYVFFPTKIKFLLKLPIIV